MNNFNDGDWVKVCTNSHEEVLGCVVEQDGCIYKLDEGIVLVDILDEGLCITKEEHIKPWIPEIGKYHIMSDNKSEYSIRILTQITNRGKYIDNKGFTWSYIYPLKFVEILDRFKGK